MKKKTDAERNVATDDKDQLSQGLRLFGDSIVIALILPLGFLLLFGWFASEVFEGETKSFDESVRNFLHSYATAPLTALMKFVSFLGSPLFLVILGAILVAVLLYLKLKRATVLFLITMAGEIVLDLALKPFFGRARPDAFFDYSLPSSYSFPSGHAFGSLCFYGILAWIGAERVSNIGAKFGIGVTAFALIFFIGLSRVYLGVHFPSDVLAGYAVGLFWISAVIFANRGRK